MTVSPPVPPQTAPPPARPGRSAWRSPFVLVAAGVLALVLVVFLIALATRDRDRRVIVGPPVGDRDAATLELVHGADSITIRSADLGDRLYRVSTPEDSHLWPAVEDAGGDDPVRVRLAERGAPGLSAVEVRLNPDVRWSVRILGGAKDEVIDLRGARLAGLEIIGGVGVADVTLPGPAGVVPVRMTGGAGQLLVHAPGGVPVRVTAGSGAGTVVVDGTGHGGVAAGTVFEPPGWSAAADRYDVQAVAGAGTLTVDRR